MLTCINIFATTAADVTSYVCKDATLPCDICSNPSTIMAQCNCASGTSWDSTVKACATTQDACTSPAYWNNTAKTCEAKVPIYVAPIDVPYTAWAINGIQITGNKTLTQAGKGVCMSYGTVYAGETCEFQGGGLWAWNIAHPAPVGTSFQLSLNGNCNGFAAQWGNVVCTTFTKKLCADGSTPIGGQCIELVTIAKPSNCTAPNTGVTSAGKCYQPTSCPLGDYACVSTTTSAGSGTVDVNDTTQGATDKTANGTMSSDGQCNGKIYLFNGKDMRCRPPGMQTGYSNCCEKTTAWLGLTKCGTTEQALGKARTAGNSGDGYCHYLGDYCAEEWNLGVTKVCVQKKDTYCCFNGLLARIIQEQGRPQIGIDWGSPTAPNCRGFTPDEFQKLDFSKIDLGEFTDQVMANAQSTINTNLGPAIDAELNRFQSTVQ